MTETWKNNIFNLVNKVTYLRILSLIVFLFFTSQSTVKAKTLFFDDFNDNNIDDWETVYNFCGNVISLDKKVIFNINTASCNIAIKPKNFTLGQNKENYILEGDVYFDFHNVQDGRFFLMFQDLTHAYWVQVTGTGLYIHKRVGDYWVGLTNDLVPFSKNSDDVYHFKFIRKKENENRTFSLYINNETIIKNYIDTEPYIEGEITIALGVQTGATPKINTWFDNMLVTDLDGPDTIPTPTFTPTPTPVPLTVFIPGLGGSFSFKGIFLNDKNANDWQMTPGAHVYDNILKAFDEDSNFHVFHYDWRKSVLDSAQKLNSFIEEKIGTGSASVNLIGHSLGGLVGRTCIEKQNGCHASKLITVGSPHLGVVDVYPAVQGGEIWRKGFMKLAFELLIHYYQKPGETRKDTIEREAPVLKELLPEFDYLTKNGSAIPWNSLQIKNSLLPQLTNSSAYSGIAQTVTGNNKSTLKSISVTDPNWLDNILGVWPDGKPSGPGVFANEGDGTVLAKSASLINLGVSNHQFDLDHGEIISSTSALEKIFSLLGKTLPEKEYSSSLDTENYLVFVAHSPIALSSPQATPDQHLHPELIIVPNPGNKQYNLVVKGADSGSYQFSVGQIFGDKVIWNDYFGQATAGLLETYSFNISQDNPLEDPFVNTNNSLKNLIIRAVSELKNSVNQQVAEAYHQNFLFYYLDNILSQLDNNPEKAIFYSNLFRDAVNYCRKSSILSNQEALNLLGKTDYLASLLETYSLNFPKTFSPEEVEQRINLTKSARELAENNVADKSRALVYLKALEKLEKAISLADLQRKHLYSSQAQFLFLESRLPN